MKKEQLYHEMTGLLRGLIRIPSISCREDKTADFLASWMEKKGIAFERKYNNIWALNKYYDEDNKPTILLNSHHDTVNPADGYTRDPFDPQIREGKLFGLGSNDAGAALVSLLGAFLHFYNDKDLHCNLIYAATGEEEVSGKNGVESILNELGPVELAVVGEPTGMQMAIAEKGLLVLDCFYRGIAGHAAHDTGDNAIYKALADLEWFKNYNFDKNSDLLGQVKMSVTQIEAGKNHNVVPDLCKIVVDVRCTDAYTLEETLEIIRKNTSGEIIPRSLRYQPSRISEHHPVCAAARKLGIHTYGSPTLSDQAFMPFPSIKIGPGESQRSHMADEFVYLEEIKNGIEVYIKLLSTLQLKKEKILANETLG